MIKERRILETADTATHEVEKRSLFGKRKGKTTTTTTTTTTTEPPYYLWITFKLTDVDWPSCINYIEFDYYDTVYNESVFMETVRYKRLFSSRGSCVKNKNPISTLQKQGFWARRMKLTHQYRTLPA